MRRAFRTLESNVWSDKLCGAKRNPAIRLRTSEFTGVFRFTTHQNRLSKFPQSARQNPRRIPSFSPTTVSRISNIASIR